MWNEYVVIGRLSFLLALTMVATTFAQKPGGVVDAQPATRFDALGDPLPAQALLRLGTKRFQHPSGPSQIILSRDESMVFSIDADHLIAWEAVVGKQLWQRPMKLRRGVRVSAAGYGISLLAIMPDDGARVTPADQGSIAFWDVTSGKATVVAIDSLTVPPKSINVSPDGKRLALGTPGKLLVCDRAGEVLLRIENPDQPLRGAIDRDRLKFGGDFSYGKFSPDGKLLALVRSSAPNSIQLLDADSGEGVRNIECRDRIVRMTVSG